MPKGADELRVYLVIRHLNPKKPKCVAWIKSLKRMDAETEWIVRVRTLKKEKRDCSCG
jgi:hypothetical protein